MKIYTKTGDGGSTSLFGGKRVNKNSARIEAYGCIDELNSLIGTVVADFADYSSSKSEGRVEKYKLGSSRQVRTISGVADVSNKLLRVQGELFVLGTDLATPADVKVKIPRVTKTFTERLEKEIDLLDKILPVLKNFILPGGGGAGSKLHLARTVARRAERSIVTLASTERISKYALSYINRLSDWLFVLARFINFQENAKEIVWKGRSK